MASSNRIHHPPKSGQHSSKTRVSRSTIMLPARSWSDTLNEYPVTLMSVCFSTGLIAGAGLALWLCRPDLSAVTGSMSHRFTDGMAQLMPSRWSPMS